MARRDQGKEARSKMIRFPQDRSFYIPKTGTTEIKDEAAQSVAYTYETAGKRYAMGFAGKAQKPTFHYSFGTEARRAEYVESFFAAQRGRIERRSQRAAERKAFRHTLKVGDVLRSPWGYEQTNVDFYQVVALKGATQVVVRRIGALTEGALGDRGQCAPDVGAFLTGHEPETYRVQEGNSLRIKSYASAYPVAFQQVGQVKVYESSYWSSYA